MTEIKLRTHIKKLLHSNTIFQTAGKRNYVTVEDTFIKTLQEFK
jgi:hypothetical protein